MRFLLLTTIIMYVPAFLLLTTTSELLCTIKTHNNYHNTNYCGIDDTPRDKWIHGGGAQSETLVF